MADITRKLATIERISAINPIPDADAIERATIRGWNVVVKKGEHKVGELVIYCEIDSIMPERPEFEFLRPRGFRIKTIKLRGTYSQGIIFSLNILNSSGNLIEKDGKFYLEMKQLIELSEGTDVTGLLGVIKYEPQIPACLAGLAKELSHLILSRLMRKGFKILWIFMRNIVPNTPGLLRKKSMDLQQLILSSMMNLVYLLVILSLRKLKIILSGKLQELLMLKQK